MLNGLTVQQKKYVHFITENYTKVFIFILLFSIILKLTYFYSSVIWSSDEFLYILAGKKILDGNILYKNIADIKPPGIFIIYSTLIKFFGYLNIFYSIKIAAISFQVIEAFTLFKIIEKIFDKNKAFFSVLIFIVALSIDPQSWPFNVFVITLLPFELYLYFSIRDNFKFNYINIMFCGLFLSLCVLCSTHFIIFLALLPIFFLLTKTNIKELFLKNLVMAISFIVPILILIAYFYQKNALTDWYWWNVVWGSHYVSEFTFPERLHNFLKGLAYSYEWFPFYILAITGIINFFKTRKIQYREMYIFIILVSLILIIIRFLPGKFATRYNSYILPAIILFINYVDYTKINKIFIKIVVLMLVLSFIGINVYSIFYPYDLVIKKTKVISEWINHNTPENEKILIWNKGFHFYHSSERDMATGFYYPSIHLDNPAIFNNIKPDDIDFIWQKFFHQLENDNPLYILDITGNFSKYNDLSRKGKLEEYMSRLKNYVHARYYLEKDFKNIVFLYKGSPPGNESIKAWRRKN